MEKKTGKNISSGAEKVETIEKSARRKSTAGRKPKKSNTAKKTQNTGAHEAQKSERATAQKRVELAKARAQKKQARIDRRLALKQKRLERKEMIAKMRAERKEKRMEKRAALKNKRIERHAERIARRELYKHESQKERSERRERERKERLALRRERAQERDKARSRRAEERRHKREQRSQRRERSRGIGGWIAAVVSLGVACLALATVVTAGAMRMNELNLQASSGARSTLYEMLSVSEDMDNNLSKLKVSTGREEQRRILTDILVDSALLENAVERIPVDAQTGTDISAFINNTGAYARSLLRKLAAGEELSAPEHGRIAQLWEVNARLTRELNTLATTMTEKELREFMGGKEGSMSEQFAQMGQTSRRSGEQLDAPFLIPSNVEGNELMKLEEIEVGRAEELARGYFEEYNLKELRYTGETQAHNAAMYNFVATDKDGVELFLQISKNGGKLAFFDLYEENTDAKFDLHACDEIAQEFLNRMGIHNARAVWFSDCGAIADIVYTSCDNGVCAYPDTIRMRVCTCKGRVVGYDAKGYLFNYKARELHATLSEEEAQSALSWELEARKGNLALIAVDGAPTLAYEFLCRSGGEEYLVYIDAETGEEVLTYIVRQGARGRYLI